jgi:hypothetical protein
MTAQISDVFMYQDREFDLAGISEGGLFSPDSLGLNPIGYSTCCYRGYQAVFAVHDGRLVLKTLNVSLYTDGPDRPESLVGPTIHGVAPKRDEEDHQFNNIYENLNYPLPYTGGVLIATDFISSLYEHMGFHPPWKYRTVWELIFEEGRLTKGIDCSQRMAEARERILGQDNERIDSGDQTNALYAWIEKSFDRTYQM